MSNCNLAPVVLFAYNRPSHLEQTLKALEENDLSEQTDVIVIVDGPRNEQDEELQRRIVNVLAKHWSFKSLTYRVGLENKGLADSIIDGVTEIVNNFGSVIVLEDDIVTEVGFLRFMNKSLERFQDDENVWHVSAYSDGYLESHYLSQLTHCWGWATWRLSWNFFIKEPKELLHRLNLTNSRYKFDVQGYDLWSQLQRNINGSLRSWAVRWYATCIIYGKYGYHPPFSLIKNIGFDGTGVNCIKADVKFHTRKEYIPENSYPPVRNYVYNAVKISFIDRIKYWILKKKGIFSSKAVYIHKSARLSTKYGGQIFVKEKTELLDGVLIFSYGKFVEIGTNCSINPYTIIYGNGNTRIGNDVLIAGHCMIVPSNHRIGDLAQPIWKQGMKCRGIVIQDDVWIGHGCTILDGVVLGKGSVIAAGSVVRDDVPAYAIVAGVPARVVKSRLELGAI